jgi:hypothetical protein
MAVLVPAATGLYVTLMVHVAAGAKVAPHVEAGARLKSPAFGPASVIPLAVKLSVAFPVFVTVTAWGAEALATV